jgi:voltage-gated potassium channel
VFLLLPFLRFLRLIRSIRALRTGRVLSSTVRGSRSARMLLGSRLGWLASVVAITVLAGSQLLYEFSHFNSYAEAFHGAALGAITAEPLPADDGFAQVMEVVFALFSVVVFGTLAASLGAFFVTNRTGSEPNR